MTSDDTPPPAEPETDDQTAERTHTDRTPTPARGPDGKFRTTVAVAERDSQAAALWSDGRSFRQVAAALGFSSVSGAESAVKRGLAAVRRPTAEALEAAKVRLTESRRVAAEMEEEARAVLGGRHIAHGPKGVVTWQGEAVVDSGPKLAAIDRVLASRKLMLSLDEREAKLLGLDSPEKVNLSGGVTYEVVGVPGDDLG